MRKMVVRIHRWGGLLFGGWLMLQVLSGVTLLYKPQVMSMLYPEPEVYDGSFSLERMLDQLTRVYPAHRLTRLAYPSEDNAHYVASLRHGVTGEGLKAVYQPRDGRFVPLTGMAKLPDGLFDFHDHILMAGSGRNLVGLLGGFLALWSLSGIYLWWPGYKKRPFTINLKGSRRLMLYDLHRVFGVLLSLFLIVLAVSGMLMIYRVAVMDLLNINGKRPVADEPITAVVCNERAGLDDFMGCLGSQLPHDGMKDLRFNQSVTEATALYYAPDAIRPKAVTKVRIDLAGPKLLSVESVKSEGPGEAFMNWMYPVHTGQVLGPVRFVTMIILGAGLMLISFFGVWLWWTKRNSKKGN